MKGIQEVANQLKTKKKITFDEYGDVPKDREEVKTPSPSLKENVPVPAEKAVKSKSAEPQSSKKSQFTIYLLEEEAEMLDEIHFWRRRQKLKTDRSTIIGEALRQYYKKESKKQS